MTTIIETHRAEIERLCRTYRVRRLDVFGSAIRDDFDPEHSDVDVLVEFQPDSDLNLFHAYMDLRRDLADVLGRPVDLVMPSAIRNRYSRTEVDATRRPVHAA